MTWCPRLEIAQPGSFAWLVIDQAMADRLNVIAGYINRGLTVTGKAMRAGRGHGSGRGGPQGHHGNLEQGRGGQGRMRPLAAPPLPNPLATAPFYAIKIAPGVHPPWAA